MIAVINESPTGIINSVNVIFTVSFPPDAGGIRVWQAGILLTLTTDYTIVNNTITMVYAPQIGAWLFCEYEATIDASSSPQQLYTSKQRLQNTAEVPTGAIDGVNTTFILSKAPNGISLKFFVSGILLNPATDYTIDKMTVTLAIPPMAGDRVFAEYDTLIGGTYKFPAYSYKAFSQAKQDLANRLYDSTKQFWTDAELGRYLVEGLRTWNAHSNFSRADFIMQSVAGTVWYDITNQAVAPNTPRSFNVLDVDLYTIIENHLLEPDTGVNWTGSLQFSIADISQAVQMRRDEILALTGCTLQKHVLAAAINRMTQLGDAVIDIRRMAWLPVDQNDYTNTPVWPDDAYAMQSFDRGYLTKAPAPPSTYRMSAEAPLSFETDTIPPVPGSYELLTVDAGIALSLTTPFTLDIPDDFTWVIKFGALADLLSRESNAKDALRAEYCNARYKQGLALLLNSPVILKALINGEPLDIDSVSNADNFRPSWQAETNGQPDLLLIAGLNMVGLATTPDDKYSISLSVVQNIPVPVDDTDNIQLGREEYDVLLDYAQHLAAFKMGGMEFINTLPLLDRFMAMAKVYNSKLGEMGEFTDVMYGQSQLQKQSAPILKDDSVISG